MDECVAVAVAEAVAVAVTEAVAEADQSIHDQSIHIHQSGRGSQGVPRGPKWSQVVPSGPMARTALRHNGGQGGVTRATNLVIKNGY